MGLLNMSLGVGLCIGPFISWFLNAVLGFNYMETFFTFAGLIFVLGSLLIYVIPISLDEKHKEKAIEKH